MAVIAESSEGKTNQDRKTGSSGAYVFLDPVVVSSELCTKRPTQTNCLSGVRTCELLTQLLPPRIRRFLVSGPGSASLRGHGHVASRAQRNVLHGHDECMRKVKSLGALPASLQSHAKMGIG